MALTLVASGVTATTNPNPNSLAQIGPFLNTTGFDINPAWTSQGVKAVFPLVVEDGQGDAPIPVHFIPSTAGATFTVTIWQYNRNSFTWFKYQTNPSTNYTGETGDVIIPRFKELPIFLQFSSISAGTLSYYVHKGVAEAK